MHSRIWTLIVNPDRFLREQAQHPSLWPPVVLVLTLGGLNIVNTSLLRANVDIVDQSVSGTLSGVATAFGVLVGIVGLFVLWLVYTAVLYAGSTVFGGTGTFRRLFLLVGWGYVPMIVGGLVSVGLTYYALQSIPTGISAQAFLAQYRSHPALQISGLASLVVAVWQGFLWVFALKHGREIELKQAVLVVLVPVCGNLAWTLWNLL